MRYFKYILSELTTFTIIRICLVVVLGITCFNCIQFFDSYFNYSDNKKMIEEKIGNQAVYRIIDNNGNAFSSNANFRVIQDLSSSISKKPYFYVKNLNFMTEDKNSFYHDGEEIQSSKGSTVYRTNLLTLNHELLKKEGLTSDFSKKDFTGETSGVILGNSYREKYNIGDTIELSRATGLSEIGSVSLENKSFKVRGFIPKSKKIMDYSQGSSEAISLDTYLVLPLSNKMEQDSNDEYEQTQIMDYFFLLSKKEDQKISYLNMAREIKELGDKHQMSNLIFQNDQSLFYYDLQFYTETFENQSIMMVLFFCFSVIQLGIIIYFLYKKRRNVYEVYYSIGSTKKEIFLIVFLSYALLLVAGATGLGVLNELYLSKQWSVQGILFGTGVYFIAHILLIFIAVGRNLIMPKRRSK